METEINNIIQKPSDFKVCLHCKRINWYENEECCECGYTGFDDNKTAVENRYNEEQEFWTKKLNYTEEEFDSIKYEV